MKKATKNHHKNLWLATIAGIIMLLCVNIGWGQATLPVATTTLSSTALPTGFTASGLGANYSAPRNPSLRIDDAGDWVQLYFTGTPGTLSYVLKANVGSGSWAGVFTIQESQDGSSWSTLRTISTSGAISTGASGTTFTDNPLSTTRYIRWTYTIETNGNIAMCDVNLTSGGTPSITLADNGTQVAAANVQQGSTAHILHQFSLAVATANTTLTGVQVTTSGTYATADLDNLKVRYSTDATLSAGDATLSTYTSVPTAGTLTFPGFTSQTINSGSTGYIFITADIAPGATVGNTISANAVTTGQLTFSSGTKSGSTTAGGTQTITAAPSASSDVFTANGESATVSSIENTAGPLTSVQGVRVWEFAIRDGGASADADALPTIVNGITFTQNAGNAFGDWTDIRSADLFDGATHLATATITSNQLQFTGAPIISVADNGSKTLSLRISLKPQVFASVNNDGDDFVFQISNTNITTAASGSSGFSAFTAINSTNGQNVLAIVATKLRFNQQPTNVNINTAMSPSPTVQATDVNNNIDLDYTGVGNNVSLTTTGTFAGTATTTVQATNGVATFSNLLFSATGTGITVSTTNTHGLTNATSNTFDVYDLPCIDEEFDGGTTAPTGWTFTGIGGTYTSAGNYGNSSPSLQMDATNDRVETAEISEAAELSFWIKGNGTNSSSALLVEGYNGSTWTSIQNITNSIPTTGTTYTYNSLTTPSLPTGITKFRFTYTKNAGNLAFDDVQVVCTATPSCTAPATQASFNAFSGITGTSITVNWTRGDGDYVLVVAKEAVAVSATPTDNTTYGADANFGDGDDIGTDEFVVYSGTGTSVNVTGLSGNTTYHFAVFEFNCDGGNEMYLAPGDAASQGTINYIATSAIVGSPFCVTATDDASVTVNFTYASSGSFAGSTFTAQLSDASGSFASPDTLGTVASNTSGSQSISGTISAGTASGTGYRIRVVSDAPAITGTDNQLDLVIVLGPENVTAGAPNEDNTQVGISWTNPATCFDEIMVVAKLSSAITASPSGDGSTYLPDAAYSGGTPFDGGYVVYKGTGTSETVTALTNDQTYYFKIFTRKGTAWSSGTEFTAMPMATTTLDYGDLAIVAVNTSQPTGDEISFVAFKTIVTGTAIDFTDNGYERLYAGMWANSEGALRFTRTGANIPAGTVITFVGTNGSVLGTHFNIYINGANDNLNWTLSSLNGSNQFNMNDSDQIWIMQGGSWSAGTFTCGKGTSPCHNATYSGNVLYGWTATGWKTAPGYNSTNGSTKPSGVECSTTDLNGLSFKDKGKYTGPTSACTKMEWIGRINDKDNWDSWDLNSEFDAATPQYRTAGATLAIVAGTFDQGKWAGFKSQEWCDCANWMHLKVPTASTNVTIPSNPNSTILLNDHADSLAVCNNLVFTGSTIKGKDGSQITINGNVTFADGVMDFTDSAVTVIVYGNWSQDTVTNFIPGSSTVQFNNNGNQTLALTGDGTQRIDFNHLTIGGTSGIKTFSDDILINGNLSIANGSAITPRNMELKGNWNNNNTTIAGFNEGSYAVTFSGTSQQTITAAYGTETFNTLNITNSSADGVTLGSNMAAYKMDLGTNGVFKAGGTARSITILNPADGNGLDGDATALFDISNLGHNLHIQCESPDIHASAMSLGTLSSVYYNRNGNQNMIANLANYANLTFGGSGTKQLIAGPLNISRSLGITGTAVVNSTISAINIGRDYSVYGDGAIDLSNHTITFSESAFNHNITGSETFYNLTMDNASNTLSLNNNITINNNLVLTNGVVNTGSNRIDLGNAATISESETSFVTGNIRVTRNIGSTSGAQAFGGLGIELTESATTDNSTQVTRVTGTALAGNTSCCGSNWSIQRYFDIVPADNTDLNASMVYQYFDHELNGVTETDLVMFRADLPFAGSDPWTAMKGTVNTGANTVSLSGLTKFSRWAAASDASPLPVELLFFTAQLQDGKVVLNWTTASETNNGYFTVERSSDAKSMIPIATINGAGNSNAMLQYQNIDEQPLTGISYYRLRQTDYDGTATFSKWAKVINAATDKELQIIKAVAKNNELSVTISCPGKTAYVLEVYDITGNRLYSGMVQPDGDWMHHDLPLLHPQNMYIIKASNAQTVKTLKVVK